MAFYVSTGARASELLSATQGGVDPGRQLITVVRKGTRERQELPAQRGDEVGGQHGRPRRGHGPRSLARCPPESRTPPQRVHREMNAGRLGVGGAAHDDHPGQIGPRGVLHGEPADRDQPAVESACAARIVETTSARSPPRCSSHRRPLTQSKSACQRSGPKTSYWMSRGDTWRSISALRTACMNGKGPHR